MLMFKVLGHFPLTTQLVSLAILWHLQWLTENNQHRPPATGLSSIISTPFVGRLTSADLAPVSAQRRFQREAGAERQGCGHLGRRPLTYSPVKYKICRKCGAVEGLIRAHCHRSRRIIECVEPISKHKLKPFPNITNSHELTRSHQSPHENSVQFLQELLISFSTEVITVPHV